MFKTEGGSSVHELATELRLICLVEEEFLYNRVIVGNLCLEIGVNIICCGRQSIPLLEIVRYNLIGCGVGNKYPAHCIVVKVTGIIKVYRIIACIRELIIKVRISINEIVEERRIIKLDGQLAEKGINGVCTFSYSQREVEGLGFNGWVKEDLREGDTARFTELERGVILISAEIEERGDKANISDFKTGHI